MISYNKIPSLSFYFHSPCQFLLSAASPLQPLMRMSPVASPSNYWAKGSKMPKSRIPRPKQVYYVIQQQIDPEQYFVSLEVKPIQASSLQAGMEYVRSKCPFSY